MQRKPTGLEFFNRVGNVLATRVSLCLATLTVSPSKVDSQLAVEHIAFPRISVVVAALLQTLLHVVLICCNCRQTP